MGLLWEAYDCEKLTTELTELIGFAIPLGLLWEAYDCEKLTTD